MADRKQPNRSKPDEWDALEDAVLRASQARRRGAPLPAESDDDVLRRLVERSRLLRGRQEALGNVVFLHGITGSDLAVSGGFGKLRNVWVDIFEIVAGSIGQLKLDPDGRREADAKLRVQTTGVNKRYYARAVVSLRAQWNVEAYAYDWRKDIDEASDGLATLIKDRFKDEPVHIVAHSMGGLVARNMILRHPKLWESMRHPGLIRGGRLIMLGTPNYGSYAIPQVMTGADALMARLERFDLKHNLPKLLEITNSFLGSYMLLPAFDKLPSALQRLYESSSWGTTAGISQAHLDRAYEFYKALDAPETVDPRRMIYIAGFNQPTITSMKIVAPGEFEYKRTNEGDGRVPHALGLLPNVPALYVEEVHGDLARNEDILRCLDEILQTGTTKQLPKTLPVRAVGAPGTVRSSRVNAGADKAALDILESIASRTRKPGKVSLSPKDRQLAEDALLHAALGARTDLTGQPESKRTNGAGSAPEGGPAEALEPPRPRGSSVRGPITLRVGARYGRIEEFAAPVIVVGNYSGGVKPVSALGAIDRKMNRWIERAVKRGMISGHVGETAYVPTQGTKVRAKGVVIAGMGDYGRFNAASLRQIMANVAQGAAALLLDRVATVLIGAGEGNMSVDVALRNLLEGFSSGLLELREEEEKPVRNLPLNALWIVEYDPTRFAAIAEELKRVCPALTVGDVELEAVAPSKEERDRASRARAKRGSEAKKLRSTRTDPNVFNEIRITVERDRTKDLFHFSALTNHAVVPTREVHVTMKKAEGAARALAEAEGRPEQLLFGRHLFNYLIPEDFEFLFDNDPDTSVRLIVDPTSAIIPWEMACFANGRNANSRNANGRKAGQFQSFGTDRRLTRQFRTLLSRPLGLIAPRNEQVRALVIADPASHEDWQLPGARAEGRLVAKLLKAANRSEVGGSELDIVVDERIGSEQCSTNELHALITSGDYDIIHFAGHGDYRSNDPAKSGWVLDADVYLSAVDIFRMRKTPWLIIANACYSGALREGLPYPSLDEARRGASIAEAFMERGVRNYLGTGWTVDDKQAVLFADTFYSDLLANWSLGKAVANGRRKLFQQPVGATWGAYQLYGDPNDCLLPREKEPDGPLAGNSRRPPSPK